MMRAETRGADPRRFRLGDEKEGAGAADARKAHLVTWIPVCSPLESYSDNDQSSIKEFRNSFGKAPPPALSGPVLASTI
jgi:hypothetical protein